ncbi:MAG: hypothetical protein ACFE7R_11640, partial [Candidatus Hodarchaeota archaeon]
NTFTRSRFPDPLQMRTFQLIDKVILRRSANLWSNKVTSRLCETELVLETSSALSISKRRYGVEVEGTPKSGFLGRKSSSAGAANASSYRGKAMHFYRGRKVAKR